MQEFIIPDSNSWHFPKHEGVGWWVFNRISFLLFHMQFCMKCYTQVIIFSFIVSFQVKGWWDVEVTYTNYAKILMILLKVFAGIVILSFKGTCKISVIQYTKTTFTVWYISRSCVLMFSQKFPRICKSREIPKILREKFNALVYYFVMQFCVYYMIISRLNNCNDMNIFFASNVWLISAC